ncbi:MAG TPA: LytTR family DNA-binding domain-containing protein [Pararobbsia sp.]|jgi:DNA-binding LytR/AlgR family response regulator|nr:LytTR family DNA-binding domain-containing protein [Pararobbsia sp.]
MKTTTALIAEDEPLLAAGLQAELRRQWPDLEIVSTVGDGQSAIDRTLELRPDVVFLDIRMPGLSGLEAAEALAEDWPHNAGPLPLFVFVTAYDEYALRAFDYAAIDYVLKPVVPERLAKTCARLRAALSARETASEGAAAMGTASPLDEMALRLRDLLAGAANAGQDARAPEPLRVIQAAAGNTIAMIPVDEVIYFEAADKYVRVVTAEREHLIRLSLRDLREQLDPARFWQIHRGTIVRADAVAMAVRDDTGKLSVTLRGQSDRLVVSRLYADRFKPM